MIPDYEETKQPVWMANLKLLFDGFALEGVYLHPTWTLSSVPTCFTGMMTPGWAGSVMTASFLWMFHTIFRPVPYKMVE